MNKGSNLCPSMCPVKVLQKRSQFSVTLRFAVGEHGRFLCMPTYNVGTFRRQNKYISLPNSTRTQEY